MKSLKNVSITALQMRFITTSPYLSGDSQITIMKSTFSRSFHPIFYNINSIKAQKSTFNRFLSSVVYCNKEYKYISSAFTESKTYDTTDSYQFDCCKFSGITGSPCLVLNNPEMTVRVRKTTIQQCTSTVGTITLNTRNTIFDGLQMSDSKSPVGGFFAANQQSRYGGVSCLSCTFVGSEYTDTTSRDPFYINTSSCVLEFTNITSNKIKTWGAVFGISAPDYFCLKNCYVNSCEGRCILWSQYTKSCTVVSSTFGRVSILDGSGNAIFWASTKMIFKNSYISPTSQSTIVNLQSGDGSFYFSSCSFTTSDSGTNSGTSNQFGAPSKGETQITFALYENCEGIPATPPPTPKITPQETLVPTKSPDTPEPTQSPVETPSPSQSAVPPERTVSATPWPSPIYEEAFGFSALAAFVICIIVFFIVFIYRELLEKSSSATIDETERVPFVLNKRSSSSERRGNYFSLSSGDDSD
ncbi:hypothetical protein TVAG_340480 [Trichomonas vaginalis G3]|uniref:Uncharacterized protein n=1 Tax=Trichomonas vaginalis (strain ATCC PRA-98 / G3) TaxID=412133 RepID=A2EKG2_TRIV3|nr:hypothetical protein TVAGG3_0979590 [Trichomonas vaginalis G3]EAY06870.1 hypothetical protein TVAG_340480 [Trichomonas vaginalis G3]KAI5489186.1 hypothetical protein TVAGG3_0979590 [Trichomonas vaginalis G3]|eukprot:XP_001319093.1 hypothetical protein [Trichomonas vaginalis G3]